MGLGVDHDGLFSLRHHNPGSDALIRDDDFQPSSDAIKVLSSASLITLIPSLLAFSSLLPASSPASTKDVFLLTEPLTLPPAASISSFASVRLMEGSVPVMTTV